MATASDDTTIRIWEVEHQRETRLLEGHTDRVLGVAFSPDGGRLLSGSRDGTVRLWNISSGEEIDRFAMSPLRGGASSLAWSRDETFFLMGAGISGSQSVSIWNMSQHRETLVFPGTRQPGRDVKLINNDEQALFVQQGRWLEFWDLQTRKKLKQIGEWVYAAAYTADGRRALTSHRGGDLRLWDVQSGEALESFSFDSRHVEINVAMTPSGSHAVTADSGTLRLWNLPAHPPP